MSIRSIERGAVPPSDSPSAVVPVETAKPSRILRFARHLRHFDVVARTAERLDTLTGAVLMMARPRWVDPLIIGLRGATSLAKTLDAKVHLEVNKHSSSVWPCHAVFAAALRPYYRATYYQDMPWYTLPGGIDVVLMYSGSSLYVTNGDVDALRDLVWKHFHGAMDLRVDNDGSVTAQADCALLTGHPHPLAAQLSREIESGERQAAILLGDPGFGKSYVIEQVAAAHAARHRGRIVRLPEAALMITTKVQGVLTHLQPDVLIVHDIDTDKPAPATVLRVAEMCAAAGVLFLATANSVDELHKAALGDHRFGAPVIVNSAPREVIRAVLGSQGTALADTQGADAWLRLDKMPLATIARLRRRVEAGGALLDTPTVTAESCEAKGNET